MRSCEQTDRRRPWRATPLAGLCLSLALALPVGAQEQAPEDEGPPLRVREVPDPNDAVVILSNGVPSTEIRIRVPGVRTYEDRHPIGERSDPASIPTRGPASQPVDVVYHGTIDYGEPSGIPTRGIGTLEIEPIPTHGIAGPRGPSRIRYHGGFR